MTTKFSKLYISLKNRLYGLGYYNAMKALEKGREIHDGWRKDGETPEYQHQLEIALFLLTLKGIKNIENVIICALLHDTLEDYPDKIDAKWIIENFGNDNYQTLKNLNKHNFKNYEDYFGTLEKDINGSLVKLGDRINNVQSMNSGKFSIEKQQKYINEVEEYFLPMAKKARKNFPEQMDAYYNMEIMLKSQKELVQLFINANFNVIKLETINEKQKLGV